jgi:hypothetical protein
MNIWDSLIDKLQTLNERAKKIQAYYGEDGEEYCSVNDNELTAFVGDYLNWYSECLSLLPNDLKEAFRTEYEKRIKDFLTDPEATITDPIYYEDQYRGESAPYFIHSYRAHFYLPSFTHRQILLEASKRQPERLNYQAQFEAVEIIERLGRRFDLVAHQLKNRYDNRETLKIADEYDVQNLFHALLKLFFDDVRPEEWTPSYANRCSRIDFLLKSEEIIIEIKKTRSSLKAKELSDELIIDKERYRIHPNCKTLVAFIYDPDKYIENPKGLENDLSEIKGNMLTRVIITQN